MSAAANSYRGLHGHTVRTLGLRILSGELLPGQGVPTESALGAELGVSRSVLREAVKVLASKGLVEVKPKTGTRVRDRRHWNLLDPDLLTWQYESAPSPKSLEDIAEIREIIEPVAARMAAERATPQMVGELEAAYERMAESVPDVQAAIDADLHFHEVLLSACDNELLQRMVTLVSGVMRVARCFTMREPARFAETLPLHREILEAVAAGQPARAEAGMTHVLKDARGDLPSFEPAHSATR